MVQPDFVALGRAFGARAVRVDHVLDVGPAIEEALQVSGPTVIEVELAIEPPYLG
jgi:thiamine pyrophosphate-dependent acetolactate synthase large subunit-like protein